MPPALLGPGQTVGSYVLLGKIGAGGIGEVWKARDRRLNRVVALKFISAERHGSSPSRDLLREARAASALNHPNIVTVFEVGESGSLSYLAMEFVEGETLRGRLGRPPLGLEEALDIATQAVAGLAAAHRHGIVHRDLKPENIMLRVDGLVKLMDFGLAKVIPWAQSGTQDFSPVGASTESGQITGTITYMSPEQARGLPLDPATDVFSFGIVLYEMLTGEHPFRAQTAMDTLSAILSREPSNLGARAPSLPREVSEIVARALEKEKGRRYPSGVELAEQLKRVKSAPAAALPEPPPAVRPKPRWMQAVGGALIALLLLLGGWYVRSPIKTTGGSTPVQSMAVMSFRTSADDARASALAQDLPEDLGAAIARTGLNVASRSSVLQLPAADARSAGAQLGVDAVLEGSVRSYGSKFKVHVELVSTRTGFQIWSETFTAEGEDLLGGEQKTAAEIAQRLRQALTASK